MENGSVGEARTRAFLIDRFWVLERSVDTDGADFLIQRRSTTQRFTDKVPPRVGVIQAKYFQDHRTTHYIPKNYVVDDKGQPLEGFFAFLHVGREDDGEMYLLSAKQIVDTLSISSTNPPERFVVGTAALTNQFRVTSRKLALDQIEHSLKIQTYPQLAAFFDRLNIPFRRFSEDDIDFHWTLPLPNPVGEISKMFVEQKKELRKLVFDMEEVMELLDSLLIEKDPRKALSLMGDLGQHIDGNRRITFNTQSNFWWDDFEDALKIHDRWRIALDTDGLLDPYIAMGDQLRQELINCTKSQPLTQKGDFLEADLEYDPNSLEVTRLTVSSRSAKARQPSIQEAGRLRSSWQLDDRVLHKTRLIDDAIENVWWKIMLGVIKDRYPNLEFD